MKLTLPILMAFLFSAAALGAAEPTTAIGGQAAGQMGADANQLPLVPTEIGGHFTNSIDMELVKVGDFWAGKFEVTQKEYQEIMGANPSTFGNPKNPVDSVNWNEAVEFCRKLTARDLKEHKLPEGYYYTLPTEAQWDAYAGDASLNDAVSSLNGRRGGPAPVGSLKPNSFGLYDTRGNVMEFCMTDPSQPFRILKGGSWNDFVEVNLRKEFRWSCRPDERQNTFGFRCVLLPGSGPKPGS